MNIDELIANINFEEQAVGKLNVLVKARLELGAITSVNRREYDIADVKNRVRELLARQILRRLYDDQRAALYNAVMDMMRADPFDSAAMTAAREKLLTAAMHQGPPVPEGRA